MSVAGRAPPTGIGFAARRVLAILQKRKIDAAPLLRRAGLSDYNPDIVSNGFPLPARRSSSSVQRKPWGTRRSDFTLRRRQTREKRVFSSMPFPPAKTFARPSRCSPAIPASVNEAVRVAIVPLAEGVTLTLNFVGMPRHHSKQNVEFAISVVLKALRAASGRNIGPSRVRFSHPRITELKEFDRFYNCRVEFGAPTDALDFAHETLSLPLLTSDRNLLETLRPYCEEATKARHTAASSLRASVENEIYRLLPHGRANVATVAKALGVSPRTLGRRLSEEGTNFAKLIDDLRRTLSLQYVREPNFTMAQIAWLLGYERSESFTHAFRRWAGQPPSQVRSASQTEAVDAKMQNSGA